MPAMRFYMALLDALFARGFQSSPLAPGQTWVIPLCSRGFGEQRMYPHFHILYLQTYDGQMGLGAIEVTEGVNDERTCHSAAAI